MDLDHINTLGLVTTIIAAPVFTGIYTLGSMLRFYAHTAIINTFSVNQAEKVIPTVSNIATESAKFIPDAENTIDKVIKLVPSAANAVALRASNAIVTVKQVIEPISQPICEAIKPQPLMITPAPVVIPNLISVDLINTKNINTSTLYGHMFRFLVDSYRIGSKIKNGEYLQASAYGLSIVIDYAVNETLSSTAGIYAESITGSLSAGLLVKGIFSMSTSIVLRKVFPSFVEGVYSYVAPTVEAEQKNRLFLNEPVIIAKKEENKTIIQKIAIIENNNANENVNSDTKKSTAEHKTITTTQEKKKPAQKTRRETSDERQFKRKLAELGVLEQDNNQNNNVLSNIISASSEKKPVRKPRRMTSKERQFERKLAALMIPDDGEKKQKQDQNENKYVEPNYDSFLNRKNDYGFVRHSDKKEKTVLADLTNVVIPTPAQRRDARLAKKENLVHVAAIDASPRELGKKSLKEHLRRSDLNMTVTTGMSSVTKTLEARNNDDIPVLLDGAKKVCEAVVNLFSLSPVMTPAKNLDWAKESAEFWKQVTQRSETRMKKAEAHLQDLLKDKQYTTPDMIERAQSTFNDCKEMYEKDYLISIPKPKVASNF